MSFFKLALLSLTRRPIEAFLVFFSIFCSMVFGFLVFHLIDVSQGRFNTLAVEGDALVGAKTGEFDLLLSGLNLEETRIQYIPSNLYETIKNQTEKKFEDGATVRQTVDQVIPFLHFGRAFGRYRVLGTSIDFTNRKKESDAKPLASGQFPSNEKEVLIGSEVATSEGLKVGDSVTVIVVDDKINNKSNAVDKDEHFKISGILKSTGKTWDYGIYSSIEAAQQVLGRQGSLSNSTWKNKVLTHFLIYFPTGDNRAFVEMQQLINTRTVAQFIGIQEQVQKLKEFTSGGAQLSLLLSIFIFLANALGILILLVSRFYQTRSQLALLLSYGWRKSKIFGYLIFEGLIVWLISTVFAFCFYLICESWFVKLFPSFNHIAVNKFSFTMVCFAFAVFVVFFLATTWPLIGLNRKRLNSEFRSG